MSKQQRQQQIVSSEIPPYFSWIIDNLLAVSAYPYSHSQLRYLTDNNIHTVVSCTTDKEPPFHSKPFLRVVRLHVLDSKAPSLDECKYFVDLMQQAKQRKECVLIHDSRGKGSAAVLTACYLVRLWECSSDYVVDHLKLIRPISIENDEQSSVIQHYYESVVDSFNGYYSRKQQPSGWNIKTSHLGKNYDSLLATLPTYSIKHLNFNSNEHEQQQNSQIA